MKSAKQKCDNCPARNRRVETVQAFGRIMNLCQACQKIADGMIQRPEPRKHFYGAPIIGRLELPVQVKASAIAELTV